MHGNAVGDIISVHEDELTRTIIDEYPAHHFEWNPNDGLEVELEIQPAAKPAGAARLSVRNYKPADFRSVSRLV